MFNFIMPKTSITPKQVHSLVAERIQTWGLCIRTLRYTQKIKAADLCERLGISHTTLRRLEQGDPAAAVCHYLQALLILGVLDEVAPSVPTTLFNSEAAHKRVRLQSRADDDLF